MNSFIKFNLSFLLILYFSCQHTIPISPESQEPIVIQDFWAPLQNSPANRIFSFARDSKGRFYAGTSNGLFRSFDNGNIWENIHSSTPIAIYVSPIDGTILLSLSGSFTTSTVYSIDNGKSWRRPSQPLSGSIGRYLSLPTGEILAGGYFHDESSGGIFISSDRGDTWEQSTLGLWLSVLSLRRFETNSMHKILFLPNSTNRWYLLEGLSESLGSRSIVVVGNDHHIYVSTFGRGIYKSKEPLASIYK